ncbi:MAG: SusC/RagA family TonB-linked outer membrane protein [Chitinophagaceae bacterium]|nr:SusC/RagA family TonB-linked outer membrane protein [Chitinophagaceae bacterium]
MRSALLKWGLFLLGFLIYTTAWSQTKTITGMVLDESSGAALQGATVAVKGKTATTTTNDVGEFTISASPTDVLEISYAGYTTKTVTVGNQDNIVVTLSTAATSKLDEVVVIGYGTQKRSKLTGSVSKLDNKILESGMRSNPAQALAGTIPGVRVATGTGRPGSLPSIILRGGTNFDGTGSPLILIDGQVRSSLSDINPEEIGSMEVLKDASATAIYGARASNGVILITSKKGKTGSSSLSVKAKTGINYLNIPYHYLNAGDYLKWSRLGLLEAIKNGTTANTALSGVGPRGTGNLYFDPATKAILDGNYDTRARWSTMRLTDDNKFLLDQGWKTMKDAVPTNAAGNWDPNGTYYDLIYQDFNYGDHAFKKTSLTQDYNLGMSGGNDKGHYFSNLGYYNEDGLSLETFYRRLNFTFNGDYNIKPWLTSESGFNFTVANWKDQSLQNGEDNYWGRMISAPPTLRDKSPVTGDWILGRDASDGNPLVNIGKYIRKNQTDKFTMNQAFTFKLLKELNLRLNGILYYAEGHNEAFNKDFRNNMLSYTNPNAGWNRDRSSSASFDRTIYQTYNAVLNYNKEIGLHTFNAMVGGEFYDAYNKGLSASGGQAPTDDFMDLGLTLNNTVTQTRGTDSWHARERILSQFGRINYDYDDKYIASFSVRRDGVSRLSPETRYGIFPAVSLGWVASREKFFSSVSDWMNYLKLRASWGKNGNIGIGTSNAIGLYEVQGAYSGQTAYNGLPGILLSTLSNPTLVWEKTNTVEVGADMGFLNNRIYASLAYYNRITDDKLANINLPTSSGFGSTRTNNGSMRNRGVELDVTGKIVQKTDFQWSLSANAAWNKNLVLKLPFNGNERNRQGGQRIYDPKTGTIIWVGGFQEGQEWGAIYGYVAEGIIRNADDLAKYNKIDITAGEAQAIGGAAGKKVASQKLITEKGLSGYIATQLGDVMWKDIDKNDTIDYRDMTSMGRTLPRWTGGFNTTISYKGLSLFARMDFALGHTQMDRQQVWSLGYMQGEFNVQDIVKETWTPENPNAKYPRFVWADQLNMKNFDRPNNMFYVNSNYLAFREVTLSYTVPAKISNKARMSGLTLSVSGQNLGYLSNKLLELPERTGFQNSAYTIPTTLIFGANITF